MVNNILCAWEGKNEGWLKSIFCSIWGKSCLRLTLYSSTPTDPGNTSWKLTRMNTFLKPQPRSPYPQWDIKLCLKLNTCKSSSEKECLSELGSQILLWQVLHKRQWKSSTLSLRLVPGQMIKEPLDNLALFCDPSSQRLSNKKRVTALSCQGKQIVAA